jgi:DNA polymerase-3 subunit delta
MKLGARDVEGFLAAPDNTCRAALLYGPDVGLASERAKRIKAKILTQNDDPFALVELSESAVLADPARLSDEINAIGLLAGKRFILIRDAGDKLTNVVKDAAPALHDGVFLLLVAEELGTRSPLRKWFEDSPHVAAIGCYRDEIRDIQALVTKSFAAANIQTPREVMDYLCSQLGNDREVTRSELEKIITYAGEEKNLSLADVESLVDYNRDTQLDDIVNAAADKSVAALDKMLAVHLREGTSTVAYLRALQRYFNRLYFVKAKMEAGYDLETVIGGLRPPVFYKQKPLLIRHARNWGMEQIVRALKLLIAAEVTSKTSDIPVAAATSRRLFQLTQVR